MRTRLLAAVVLLAPTEMPPSASGADADPAPARRDAILMRFKDEFVKVSPGAGKYPASFEMGSRGDGPIEEKPAFKVSLKASFAMAKHEVTQELYEAVMGKNPSRWKGPRNSVEMVSWQEAVAFCRKATSELHDRKLLTKDEVVRLPSEAEWEYCCRAGTTTAFSFGADDAGLKDHGWFQGNAKGKDPPVGAKQPNAWGLYDMHGYVWEWCADAWHPNYKGAPADGSTWQSKQARDRVIRGGSWKEKADHCRSASRRGLAASTRDDGVGFRCVLAKAAPLDKGNGK